MSFSSMNMSSPRINYYKQRRDAFFILTDRVSSKGWQEMEVNLKGNSNLLSTRTDDVVDGGCILVHEKSMFKAKSGTPVPDRYTFNYPQVILAVPGYET